MSQKLHHKFGSLLLLALGLWVGNEKTVYAKNPTFPDGAFPELENFTGEDDQKKQSLRSEIKNLTDDVTMTMKKVAAKRNLSCFGGPCLLQGFPIMYTRQGLGFYGGFHMNLANITEVDPYAYSLSLTFIRADTKDYIVSSYLDIPRMSLFKYHFRSKGIAEWRETKDSAYFGQGSESVSNAELPLSQLRYGLKEQGYSGTVILPLFKSAPRNNVSQSINLLMSGATHQHKPFNIVDGGSPLFDKAPIGVQGGISTVFGGGILIDSRDKELFTRQGWALELSLVAGGGFVGNFKFNRLTLVDRRYFSYGKWTLAHRFTADALFGEAPFWEYKGVGGIDPIRDISSFFLLKGYWDGRFHEERKGIENLELRYNIGTTHVFGIFSEIEWWPIGLDLGRLGNQNAVDFSTGLNILFNRVLYVKSYYAYSEAGHFLRLGFGTHL